MNAAILTPHGESVYSLRGLLNGRPGIRCPLTDRGVAQARALGDQLAGQPIDLCATSRLTRTLETADIALRGRRVRRVVRREFDDPRYGRYEGASLQEYLTWAITHDSAAPPPGGGECRQVIIARYARGLRWLSTRPEDVILVITHSLPIAYVELALAGRDPAPQVPLVPCADPRSLTSDQVETVAARLEAWTDAPTW